MISPDKNLLTAFVELVGKGLDAYEFEVYKIDTCGHFDALTYDYDDGASIVTLHTEYGDQNNRKFHAWIIISTYDIENWNNPNFENDELDTLSPDEWAQECIMASASGGIESPLVSSEQLDYISDPECDDPEARLFEVVLKIAKRIEAQVISKGYAFQSAFENMMEERNVRNAPH